jgi:hypothetical protein
MKNSCSPPNESRPFKMWAWRAASTAAVLSGIALWFGPGHEALRGHLAERIGATPAKLSAPVPEPLPDTSSSN